jgi:hypothetical protein
LVRVEILFELKLGINLELLFTFGLVRVRTKVRAKIREGGRVWVRLAYKIAIT